MGRSCAHFTDKLVEAQQMQDILGASADKLTSQDWNRSCLELRCPFPILLCILKHRQFILVCLKILDHLYISLISLPCFFFFLVILLVDTLLSTPGDREGLFASKAGGSVPRSPGELWVPIHRIPAVWRRAEHSCGCEA